MTAIRILLTVVFGWSLLKTGSLLVRDDSMDLLILTSGGLAWSYWLLVPAIAVCLAGALTYLWWPADVLYRLAQAAVILNVVETTMASLVAMSHPGAAIAAFVASRKGRGLPVRDDVVRPMDSPSTHLVPLAISVLLGALWLMLLHLLEKGRRQADLKRSRREVTTTSMNPAPGSGHWVADFEPAKDGE